MLLCCLFVVLLLLLLQIAPVVDASSSQSRADVLGILLSAVLLLTGLQWLALKPKIVDAVCWWCYPTQHTSVLMLAMHCHRHTITHQQHVECV